MAAPSDFEQLVLEYINAFRADPGGEFNRLIATTTPFEAVQANITSNLNFWGVDAAALQAQLAALTPQAALAWNDSLSDAAEGHSQAMIDANLQSHQVPGEDPLGTRVTAAGYTGWSNLGENIFSESEDPLHAHAGFVIDWGFDDSDFVNGQLISNWQTNGDGIQDGAGHRANIMSSTYTEIGIGVIHETDPATNNVGPYVMTQDFGARFAYQPQFVGVVIDDLDGDNFYDIGEGLGGVSVTISNASNTYTTTTWNSGGYQLTAAAGTYTITFSGGGLTQTITQTATIGSSNVKVDGVQGSPIPTAGDDNLTGTSGRDIINLLAGNDTFDGLAGNDDIFGDSGDDLITGGAGADVIWGGTHGSDGDTASYSGSALGVTVNLTSGTARGGDAQGDTLNEIENLTGSSSADVFTGDANANTLTGLGGADKLLTKGGDDKAFGGAGNDRLFGDAGNDELRGGADDDYISGQGDNDDLFGDAGEDTMFGGTGNDTISGGTQNDMINGGGGEDDINGDEGIDDITGGGGNDIIRGGDGNDILKGYSGLDTMYGDAGNDDLFGDVGSDTMYGGIGNDILNGFQGMDMMFGGVGDDTMSGGDNSDTMDGGADNDIVRGNSGNDTVMGGAGNDTVNGGANADIVDGGIGTDLLTGESGNDTFVYAAGYQNDSISDFDDAGNDTIDISAYGFTNYTTQVEGLMSQVGNHVDIDFGGGDILRLRNTDINDMGSDDFILV